MPCEAFIQAFCLTQFRNLDFYSLELISLALFFENDHRILLRRKKHRDLKTFGGHDFTLHLILSTLPVFAISFSFLFSSVYYHCCIFPLHFIFWFQWGQNARFLEANFMPRTPSIFKNCLLSGLPNQKILKFPLQI